MLYLQFHSSTCSGGEKIEVAKLKKTNGQLNVRGGVSTADLTAGVEYEVVFVVKLKKGGCGWEHPVIVILSVPGEQRDMRRRRQVDLCGQQREDGGWIELIKNLCGQQREQPPHFAALKKKKGIISRFFFPSTDFLSGHITFFFF